MKLFREIKYKKVLFRLLLISKININKIIKFRLMLVLKINENTIIFWDNNKIQ